VAGFGTGLWLAGQLSASASADEAPIPGLLAGTVSAAADLTGTVVHALPPVGQLPPPVVRPVVDEVVVPVVDAVVRPVLGAVSTPLDLRPPAAPGPLDVLPAAAASLTADPAPSTEAAAPAGAPTPDLPSSSSGTTAPAATEPAAELPQAPAHLPLAALPGVPPTGSAPSSATGAAGTDLPPAALLSAGSPADGDHPSGAPADGSAPSLDTPEDPGTSPD
jgi:hypothetical protein